MQVSFVIPVYNSEKTLQSTLKSIFNQAFVGKKIDYEVIAVDNLSSDKSVHIIQSFPEVRYLSCKKQGAGPTRNVGWKAARGKYVAFIDSDITLPGDWLENAVEALDGGRFVGAQSKIVPTAFDQNQPFLNLFRYESTKITTLNSFNYLYKKNASNPIINTSACIYLRSALEEVDGFDENFERFEDSDLSARVFKQIGSLAEIICTPVNVYWSRGLFAYLLRNFKNGRYSVAYTRKHFDERFRQKLKWNLRGEPVYLGLNGRRLKLYYAFCYFLYQLGAYFGRLVGNNRQATLEHLEVVKLNKNPIVFQWKSPEFKVCLAPESRIIRLENKTFFINMASHNQLIVYNNELKELTLDLARELLTKNLCVRMN